MPFESQWFQIPDADSDELLPEWDSARIHPVLWRQVNGLLCPSLTWLTDLAVQLFIFIDLKLFQDVKIISASTQVVSGTRYMMQVEITGSDGEVSTHTYTYVLTRTHIHMRTYTYHNKQSGTSAMFVCTDSTIPQPSWQCASPTVPPHYKTRVPVLLSPHTIRHACQS